MFILTKSGKKLKIDNSQFNEEEDYELTHKPVALIDDDFELELWWVVQINKVNNPGMKKKDWEFIDEVHFDHKPTIEELGYLYCTYNLGWEDYLMIDVVYKRKCNYD